MAVLPEQLAKVNEGIKVREFILPYLEEEIPKMERAVENRIYTLIYKGTLTPEAAYGAWIEKRNLHALLVRFQQKVLIAQATGERLGVELDPQIPTSSEDLPLPV